MNFKQCDKGVCASKGFTAAGIHCGVRKNKDKKDLALIYCDVLCDAAAMYTQNKVAGAPIIVTKKHLEGKKAQAVIANSGNANTCNADGEQNAQLMSDSCAKVMGISPKHVIVASTGVIGQPLNMPPILDGMAPLKDALSENGSEDAANAIMTTDTKLKEIALEFKIGGKTCHVGGIAKGSGMIHPNMATMLCFLTTDVSIDGDLLQKALKEVVDVTFNMVSVDGDTSTNDMVSIMASGLAENQRITECGEDYEIFKTALYEMLLYLSRAIAKDGEGATKLLECKVEGADDLMTARKIAKSVITSSLFKAAMFGKDANWGRILCAIGYTDAQFDITKVAVSLKSEFGEVDVCKNGAGVDFSEEKALEVLQSDEITIHINMNSGNYDATAWGCDLTYDYVKINGDYRT
ncbi:MAG: bifunctional glutamate N-acetyltransferase/amino-acid acetyltransferase ArgJ [Oscillospiraceae bacterium]|nr:bifunctional glutamate N-acetyltransferase/amino-acid acetyltransferase ArgJ [Oscillospiraceae bacterium]